MSGTNVAKQAAVAQSVERRLGKAEVGGSSPLGSFDERVSQVSSERMRL